MGILEKTRALQVSRLGPRIEDSRADESALRNLVAELERARSDILRGLDAIEREQKYLIESGKEPERRKAIAADISEGEVELKRVVEGIAGAREALETLPRSDDEAE